MRQQLENMNSSNEEQCDKLETQLKEDKVKQKAELPTIWIKIFEFEFQKPVHPGRERAQVRRHRQEAAREGGGDAEERGEVTSYFFKKVKSHDFPIKIQII